MKAILTDTSNSTVFATLTIGNTSLNVGASVPNINSNVTLQISDTKALPIPSSTVIYSLQITDNATPANTLASYASVNFVNYTYSLNDNSGTIVATQNSATFKVNS